MAGYRTPFKKQQDHAAIARMLLEGHKQKDIARELGLSPQCVSKDRKEIEASWRNNVIDDMVTHKALELARLNHREEQLWEAWENSIKEGRKRTQQWAIPGMATPDDPNPNPIPSRASLITENDHGDPRYMQLMLKISHQRCRLLNLYEPLKIDAPPRESDDPSKMTLEERKQRILEMLQAVTGGAFTPAADDTKDTDETEDAGDTGNAVTA